MGYEVAGGLGVRLACPDRDVFVMVGDGSYLMMATELATAVQEGIKIITVLVQNHGYASIGVAVGVAGLAALRHQVPLPQPRDRPAGRRPAAAGPGRQRGQLRPRGDQDLDRREFADAIKAAKAADGLGRDLRRDRPADRRAGLRVLVGRAGQRDLDAWTRPSTARRTYDEHKATQKLVPVSQEGDSCPRSPSAPPPTRGASGSRAIRSRSRPTASSTKSSRPATSGSSSGRTATCRRTRRELQDQLDAHGLQVLAGTVFEHLHRPDSWDCTSGPR